MPIVRNRLRLCLWLRVICIRLAICWRCRIDLDYGLVDLSTCPLDIDLDHHAGLNPAGSRAGALVLVEPVEVPNSLHCRRSVLVLVANLNRSVDVSTPRAFTEHLPLLTQVRLDMWLCESGSNGNRGQFGLFRGLLDAVS